MPRLKSSSEVRLELPKKIDRIVICPLTDLQRKAYRNILMLPDVQSYVHGEDACDCGSADADGLPYMRKNCCDPPDWRLVLKVRVGDCFSLRLADFASRP